MFLTGARIFFGSFESAIYLFRSITGVPDNIQGPPPPTLLTPGCLLLTHGQ